MYENIIHKHKPAPDNLIYILHDIQDCHPQHYITETAATEVAHYLNVPVSHVYGVITFYTMFSTKPRGKNIIRLCESPPCHLKGSDNILRKLKELLKIKKTGETSADGLFTLETCACLGVCGNAPVIMVNETVYGDLTEDKVEVIIEKVRGGKS
ncbi:MAG: NAD(P)H-dependent oxidoreductase subunit E [Candidatus Cloacimonetes bacterium]|nr:NAD(P)H-dependent oxidoreductase subunit E [Candidatus Cloacimonadota bacterium]